MNYRTPSSPPSPLLRVYWPSSLRLTEQYDGCWLVGWYRRAAHLQSICVATTWEEKAGEQLSSRLSSLSAAPHLRSIWQHAGGVPVLVGCVCSSSAAAATWRPELLHSFSSHVRSPLLLLASCSSQRRQRPCIERVVGSAAVDGPLAVSQVILFPKPRRGTFLAATPFPFRSAFGAARTQQQAVRGGKEEKAHAATDSEQEMKSSRRPVDSRQDADGPASSASYSVSDLDCALRQMNSCWKLEEELSSGGRSGAAAHHRRSRSPPGLRVVAALSLPVLSLAALLSSLLSGLARAVLSVLSCPLPVFLSYLSSYPVSRPRLRDVSTLASQLSFRLLTVLHWPSLWRASQLPPSPSADYHASSLLLFSSLFQVAVDLVAGCLLCSFLLSHQQAAGALLHELGHLLHSDVIRANVLWFQQSPVGLKLNASLNSKLGLAVLALLSLYDAATAVVARHEALLLSALACSGLLGASTLLSLSSDLLSVLTLHVDLLHTVFSALYRLLLSLLSSLFLLFRGKKRNVLRLRVDSLQPSTPQLLLGALLFAITIALAPTVCVYYAFFSIVRLLVTGGQAVLWWGLAACNCFPFLPLAVWLGRRGALPGGVTLELIRDAAEEQREEAAARAAARGAALQQEEEEDEEEQERLQRVKAEIMTAREGGVYSERIRYRHVLRLRWSLQRGERGGSSGAVCLQLVSRSVPVRSLFFQYRVALSYLQQHYNARKLAAALFTGARLPTAPPASAGLAAASAMQSADSGE